MSKTRLDQLVFSRALCDSREQARRLILAGEVMVGGHVADKPGLKVADDAEIVVKERPKFVSRGGFKLEGALDAFGIDVEGLVGCDIGASTGGFTDCLLQRGAKKVYCFDVGTNQLVWKIRDDARVQAREQFNARHLEFADVGEWVDIVVIDVSFISLTKILPAAFRVLGENGGVVCLIKPQFECAREDIGKGGIVRSDGAREGAIKEVKRFVEDELEKRWNGVLASSITGTDGNQEYLAWLSHNA